MPIRPGGAAEEGPLPEGAGGTVDDFGDPSQQRPPAVVRLDQVTPVHGDINRRRVADKDHAVAIEDDEGNEDGTTNGDENDENNEGDEGDEGDEADEGDEVDEVDEKNDDEESDEEEEKEE